MDINCVRCFKVITDVSKWCICMKHCQACFNLIYLKGKRPNNNLNDNKKKKIRLG